MKCEFLYVRDSMAFCDHFKNERGDCRYGENPKECPFRNFKFKKIEGIKNEL